AAMESNAETLIGVGVYSIAESSDLTDVPARAIRRWSVGYRYQHEGETRHSFPVWRRDITPLDGRIALSFLDVMEIRFIHSFRCHRVSWPAIREAAKIACDLFKDRHPFTRGRFKTDGTRIFRQIEDSGKIKLFDLNRVSWVFNEIVEPSLYRGIEF